MHRRRKYRVLVKKEQKPLGRHGRSWEDDIKTDITSRDDAILI
jgi:hypothetical protein